MRQKIHEGRKNSINTNIVTEKYKPHDLGKCHEISCKDKKRLNYVRGPFLSRSKVQDIMFHYQKTNFVKKNLLSV